MNCNLLKLLLPPYYFQKLQFCGHESDGRVLQQFLNDIIPLLSIGGRCSVITFHSLEDRLLKRFIRSHKDVIQPVNKRVFQLTYHEAKKNTRARSAKCRVFERIK